jgi:hypothetical protein
MKVSKQIQDALTLGFSFAVIVLGGCGAPCGNDFVSEHKSPNGREKAVVFVRSCGATTGFVTEVSVLPSNAGVPWGWGNAVAIGDDPNHPAPRNNNWTIEVHIEWESDRLLKIAFPKEAIAKKYSERVGTVVIEYATY